MFPIEITRVQIPPACYCNYQIIPKKKKKKKKKMEWTLPVAISGMAADWSWW